MLRSNEPVSACFAEAREAAGRFQGKPILNHASGQAAVVTRNTLDKMLSRSAVHKSESLSDHLLTVANLDHLFGRALLGWSKEDRNQDPNITAVHRFFAPLLIGTKARLVKLTVKEFSIPDQGTKIYSVETLEVKEASPVPEMVDADRADGSRLLTGPTGLIES